MKTSASLFITAAFLIAVAASMNACKKDSTSTGNSNDNAAANMSANGAASDNAYDDVFQVGLATGNDNNLTSIAQQKGSPAVLGSYYCAAVTLKTTAGSFPDTLTVDFGSGCTSADSIVRSGSVTYIFSGRLSTPGTVISATLNNYTVNGYKLGGTYTIKNTSPSLISPQLTTTVTQGNIVFPNDSAFQFAGTKTISLVSGSPTNISSLVFNITGSYNISKASGESLSANVTTPLERKETCHYVDKGVISFTYTRSGASLNGTLDYGSGACDNTALITIGSFTKNIILP